jgi:hypothetical protein
MNPSLIHRDTMHLAVAMFVFGAGYVTQEEWNEVLQVMFSHFSRVRLDQDSPDMSC